MCGRKSYGNKTAIGGTVFKLMIVLEPRENSAKWTVATGQLHQWLRDIFDKNRGRLWELWRSCLTK